MRLPVIARLASSARVLEGVSLLAAACVAASLLGASCAPAEAPWSAPQPAKRAPRERAAAGASTSRDDTLTSAEARDLERCGDDAAGFDKWASAFAAHAVAHGISADVARRALGNVSYDPEVIALDRAQRRTKKTFEELAASHVTPARIRRGKQLLRTHAELLARIRARFGVPEEIVVAIWGLETDFGENQGNTPTVRALATLAWDCRRAPRFRAELSAVLRLAERDGLPIEHMRGAWAGEVGQTQFLPSSWERFGIDFDEDGRIDLTHSAADALGSTANYLAANGWRAGEAYEEGSASFAALATWNASETYRRTIVLFASKLAKGR